MVNLTGTDAWGSGRFGLTMDSRCAIGWLRLAIASLLQEMGNTLGKSGERRGVMLEFENLNMTVFQLSLLPSALVPFLFNYDSYLNILFTARCCELKTLDN